MDPRRSALVVTALLAGCMYDFDAHFSGGAEDCTNGVDDDGNGKADCADPSCTEFACAPSPPSGWAGPVLLVSSAMSAACPEGWKRVVEAPSCSACTCASDGASCSVPTTNLFQNCGDSVDDTLQPSSACSGVNVSGGLHAATGNEPQPTGACTAGGGDKVASVLCETKTGACPAGGVCAPRLAGELCVYRSGPVDCPSGYPTSRARLAPNLAPSAGCGACACGAPSGTCAGATHLFVGSNCTGTDTLVPNDGTTCIGFAETPHSQRYDPGAHSLACAPSGGEPQGAGGDVITVCCEGEGSS